ncbi:MAG: hypothetical protein AABZ53_04155 [Planctomycetota bacterium]
MHTDTFAHVHRHARRNMGPAGALLGVLTPLLLPIVALGQGIHNPDGHYFSFTDSPFAAPPFEFLHLENFEDGLLDTPGVTNVGGIVLRRSDEFSDSVDADDGVIDGNGNTGGAVTGAFYSAGLATLRFNFNPAALGGRLPTHVGLVMTDCSNPSAMTLSAFRQGALLGSISGNQSAERLHFTAGDRFYGFVDAGGIDSIVMTATSDTDWAMDHLQYGRRCPADFDGDGTVDFFDYDAFVVCFEGGACPPGKTADFDGDGSVDFFDYDAFVVAFETGC